MDDFLAIIRELLNANVFRSDLNRCLYKYGMGNLHELETKETRPKHSGFKAHEPGYIRSDVKYPPQTTDETQRQSLFVTIDPATRWEFIRILDANERHGRALQRSHRRGTVRPSFRSSENLEATLHRYFWLYNQ